MTYVYFRDTETIDIDLIISDRWFIEKATLAAMSKSDVGRYVLENTQWEHCDIGANLIFFETNSIHDVAVKLLQVDEIIVPDDKVKNELFVERQFDWTPAPLQ